VSSEGQERNGRVGEVLGLRQLDEGGRPQSTSS
jgi:hypothetical protein